MYVIPIEGNEACEVLNLFRVFWIVEVNDSLNLFRVRRSASSLQQMSKNSKSAIFEVALFQGETEASDSRSLHHFLMAGQVRRRVLQVNKNVVSVFCNVLMHVGEVVGDSNITTPFLHPWGTTSHSKRWLRVSNTVL